MSKGHGRVERRIIAELSGNPDTAFVTFELCECIYGSPVHRKHRASVTRAMRKLADSEPPVASLMTVHGVGSAIYNSGSVTGGLVARAKLALMAANRPRIHQRATDPEDAAWAIWAQAWGVVPTLPATAFEDHPEELAAIDMLQRWYGLDFKKAQVLLLSYGTIGARSRRNCDPHDALSVARFNACKVW